MLLFIRLGVTNSLRQLGKNLLLLLTMVLSAMSLTSALSFSQGNTNNSYRFYRQLLGGEILVSPVRWAGQQVSDITSAGGLQPLKLPRTGLSWLEAYYPELYTDGFLGTPSGGQQVFDQSQIRSLTEEAAVSGYHLQLQFPASLTNVTRQSNKWITVSVLPLPASGRLPGLEQLDLSQYLNSDQPIALLNAWLPLDGREVAAVAATIRDSDVIGQNEDKYPTPDEIAQRKLQVARNRVRDRMELPGAQDTARLRIPTLRRQPDGSYLPDYIAACELEVLVLDQVSIPTRQVAFTDDLGNMTAETAYLHGGYVWLPPAVWQRVWEQVSAGDVLPGCNLALAVRNMDDLEQTVRDLQNKYPQFTFVSVADFAYRMETSTIIDRFYRAPQNLYRSGESRLAMPLDLSRLMGVLFYLIAGMLIASRMLTGAAARRSEIGILKALGARRTDIATMVLSEALLIAAIGTSIGFLLVRAGGMIIEIGNHVPWQTVLTRTVQEYGAVGGVACLVVLVFTLLPALRLSNLTVMGVLRGE